MKKLAVFLIVLFSLGLVYSITGCQTAQSTTTTTTIPLSGTVEVSVITNSDSYTLLQPIIITMTVTNGCTSSIEVINGPFFSYRFRIMSGTEEIIEIPEIMPSAMQNHSLASGSTEVTSVTWDQRYAHTSETVVVGTYDITGYSVFTTKLATKEIIIR